MLTETPNPQTARLDRLSALEIVTLMNAEDASVAVTVRQALPHVAEAVEQIVTRFTSGGRLFYVGAGTSGRLGVLDAAECVPTFGTPPEWVQALIAGGDDAMLRSIEGAEDDPDQAAQELQDLGFGAGDVLVGIAASGSTPYVLGAVRHARDLGAYTVGISCNAPAPLLEQTDCPIALPVGPEALTGSTRLKAGTAQKMVLNMLSTALMVRLGKTYGNLMVDVQVTNTKLQKRARGIVMQVGQVSEAEAEALLLQAGGQAKRAIVMARRNVDTAEADRLLDSAQGRLYRILEAAELP